jgi:hypothetical protein
MVTVGKSFTSEGKDNLIPLKKNNEDPFNPVTYNAMPTRSFEESRI